MMERDRDPFMRPHTRRGGRYGGGSFGGGGGGFGSGFTSAPPHLAPALCAASRPELPHRRISLVAANPHSPAFRARMTLA